MRTNPRIGGISEIAKELDVSPQAVSNWAKRYAGFPKPLAQLHMGTIYDVDQVLRWHRSQFGEGPKPKGTLMTPTEIARYIGFPVGPPNVTQWAKLQPDFPKPSGYKDPTAFRRPVYDLDEVLKWYDGHVKRRGKGAKNPGSRRRLPMK